MEKRVINKKVLPKSFMIWSLICILNAGYSFRIALEQRFEPLPMIAGIFIFIVLYTIFTSTYWFLDKIRNKNFLFAIVSGFLIKVPLIFYLDLFAGFFSVSVIERNISGIHSFSKTLLITIVEGTVLSIIIWAMVFAIFITIVIAFKVKAVFDRRKVYSA